MGGIIRTVLVKAARYNDKDISIATAIACGLAMATVLGDNIIIGCPARFCPPVIGRPGTAKLHVNVAMAIERGSAEATAPSNDCIFGNHGGAHGGPNCAS